MDIFNATSASATINGRSTVYVIGGEGTGNRTATIKDAVKAYDPVSNVWKAKAPIPVPVRSTNGAVELDGKIYVAGGVTRVKPDPDGPWRIQILQTLYVYTPATNTWVRKRDMPVRSSGGGSAGYQGKLYVAAEHVVYRYDPNTDQWTKFAERPGDELVNVTAGVIGGKLYIVTEAGGALDILDLATGAWSSGPKRPFRACNVASATLQAKLYLFGNCDDSPTDPAIRLRGLVFDPATNSWGEAATPPAGTSSGAALARVVVNAKTRLSLVQGTRPNNHYQFIP